MKPTRSSFLALTLAVALVAPASAHQPVNLGLSDGKETTSKILVDGTVSWAIFADFKRAGQVRHFRFALRSGERLRAEYLILDRKPENQLKESQLPVVKIKSPTGETIPFSINERTKFYEPFGGVNYLYLSRHNQKGEPGLYTVSIRAKQASSVVIAIGSREVRGEVLQIGKVAATCPAPITSGAEIPIATARQLIGLSEQASQLCTDINNWGYRIAQRDGEDFPLTMDYSVNRVNVSIENGRIIDVTVG